MNTEDDDVISLARSMMDAARAGRGETILPLLDEGAPIDMQDADGNTMLMLAAYHGHADLVRALLGRGADPDKPNDRGQTPLAGVAFKGFEGAARALLDGGADPDAGTPSARETAAYFERQAITVMIDQS